MVALAPYMLNRRWIWRPWPYPHVVAYDVFLDEVYERLVTAFNEVMWGSAGHSYLQADDIFGTTIMPDLAPSFHPILSRAWHDMIARLFGVNATGHVACGLHHHKVGSAHGYPHNDLNSGWFAGDPGTDSVELSQPQLVEYTTGKALVAGLHPRETVRAIAVLYYLGNEDWEPGDGGATGLYLDSGDDTRLPRRVVPPMNNSLLAFECTPTSWHCFISNRRSPRNSLIMWLHRPKAEVIAMWGEESIMPYGWRPGRSEEGLGS